VLKITFHSGVRINFWPHVWIASVVDTSSSRALQSIVYFGFQYNFPPFLMVSCIVFSTNLFLRDWDVNPMPNPQPGGPGCLS
jgi:hypothetical protein